MKRYYLLSALALLCTPVFAQVTFEGHYGKTNLDVAYSAAATTGGGYIITGLSQSGANPDGDIVVIKTSAHGDTLWSRTFGGPKLEGGNFVMQTADGNYLISGHTEDWGARDCDAFLMKLDQQGHQLWLKVYGGDSDDIAQGVVELNDGSLVVSGVTASYGNPGGSPNRHLYFLKTNSTGDTTWTKVYGGAGVDGCYSIATMADGGFLVAGWSTSFGNGEMDGWLLRLNSSGDTLWTKLYKNGGDTRFYKIIPSMDGGYVLVGYTTPTTTGITEGFIIKLDATCHEEWRKTISDAHANINLKDATQLPTGNFMFAGGSYATDSAGYAYLLTTDAAGNMISSELSGGLGTYANVIASQGNNSYIIAGASTKYGDDLGDLYFLEMDNTISAHVPSVSATGPRFYPNPIHDQPAIVILPESEANSTVEIDITATDGRKAYSRHSVLAKDIVISREYFQPGKYFYRITCKDGTTYKGSFVVE